MIGSKMSVMLTGPTVYVYLYFLVKQIHCLKLSETVEKGKHPEKFGLAEDKAGPDREYILQVGIN